MHIAFLIQDITTEGGTERTTCCLATELAHRGHDVTIVSIFRNEQASKYTADGVQMVFLTDSSYTLKDSALKRFIKACGLRQTIRDCSVLQEADVIICQKILASYMAYMAGFAQKAVACEHFKYAMTIYPEISRRFESSKSEGVKFLKQVMLYAGLAAAVVSVFTFFIAPLAIRIVYGAGFTPAIEVLRWLAPIPFLVMMATLLTIQGLYGMGLQRWAPWIGLTLAIICISMNLILIPRIGVVAVCISWIVSEILECTFSGLVLLIHGRKITR